MLQSEKNSYKEFDNEKKVLRLQIPPPPLPHNISNGPSLKWRVTFRIVVFTSHFSQLSTLS